jgi:hypothetical protein
MSDFPKKMLDSAVLFAMMGRLVSPQRANAPDCWKQPTRSNQTALWRCNRG